MTWYEMVLSQINQLTQVCVHVLNLYTLSMPSQSCESDHLFPLYKSSSCFVSLRMSLPFENLGCPWVSLIHLDCAGDVNVLVTWEVH